MKNDDLEKYLEECSECHDIIGLSSALLTEDGRIICISCFARNNIELLNSVQFSYLKKNSSIKDNICSQ